MANLNVRLSENDQFQIVSAIQAVVPDEALACIKVYGSRADLNKKGGDIDLLIELDGEVADRKSLAMLIRRSICDRIGEQKIDLFLIHQNRSKNLERENDFWDLINSKTLVTIWSKHDQSKS